MSDRISISVDDAGLKKAKRDIDTWSAEKKKAIKQAVVKGLFAIHGDATKKTPVGVSAVLRSSIHVNPDADGLGGSVDANARYAKFVEYGRGPGKAPPPDAMELWVRRVIGLSDEREIKEAAYLIGQKIARDGTKPQPFMRPAARENEAKIILDIKQALATP